MSTSEQHQTRYDRLEHVMKDALARRLSPDEHIWAWSFVQGITPGGLMVYGAGSALYMRQFILAATNKRVYLIRLDMRNRYKYVECKVYSFDEVRIYRVKQHLIMRFAWSADMGFANDGRYRFTYYPHKKWAQLDPVLAVINEQLSHQKTQ